jgi:hypothetical protein
VLRHVWSGIVRLRSNCASKAEPKLSPRQDTGAQIAGVKVFETVVQTVGFVSEGNR